MSISSQPASVVEVTSGREDRLTGLANRAEFDAQLATAVDVANSGGRGPVAVLMFDVDHFKSFNETYGHKVADEVLQEIAHAMQLAVRPNDLIARYGGEEFALLSQGCTGADIYAEGERIRRAVETTRLHTKAGELSVTVSGGAAVVHPDHGEGAVDDIVGLADEALQEAKAGGRNQIRLAR